jgi:hypothetical protein
MGQQQLQRQQWQQQQMRQLVGASGWHICELSTARALTPLMATRHGRPMKLAHPAADW